MWQEATVSPRCCIKVRTSALSACRKDASWEHAFHLLRAISSDGLQLNLIPINVVISVCEKSGRWCLGTLLHRGLRDHLLKPDVITINSSISACEKEAWTRLDLSTDCYWYAFTDLCAFFSVSSL